MPDASAGGTQANVIFNFLDFKDSQNIYVSGMTIAGARVGLTSAPGPAGKHIHILGNKFTNALDLFTPTDENLDVLVDGNSFINLDQACNEGRVGVCGLNISHSVVNGITISNNLFSGSGSALPNNCSDGVQINGAAYGTVIGPGNEFTAMAESTCVAHVDPIQFFNDSNTTVTGNWFHDNGDGSGGVMTPDGTQNTIITNNVFASTGYAYAVNCGGCVNVLIEHNTVNPSQAIHFANANGGGASSGNTLRNNILLGGSQNQGTTVTFNLYASGGTGTNINGTPTYVGGSTPSTYAGYALTTGSTGHNAASDGHDMGINITSGAGGGSASSGKASFGGKGSIK
jgi:hypothetical protein